MTDSVQANDDSPKKYSPFEVKELLIEFAMRNYHNHGMTTNLKDEDLDRVLSFELDGLETIDYGAPFYIGTDLYTALENLRYEAGRNDFLTTITVLPNSDTELLSQMRELLHEESKQLGYSAKELEHLSASQQVLIIAGARIKAATLAPEPQDASASRDHFDFTVLLTTLRGGYAGTTQTQRLYFKFPGEKDALSSYATLLARLQDATQLSVIPPLEPGEPYRTSSSTTDPAPLHGGDGDANTPVNALRIMLPTPPDSFTTFPATQLRRDRKGYTILDGAWIYTSKRGNIVLKGKLGEEKDKKLDDKASYDNMVEILKDQDTARKGQNEKSSPSPGALVVEITHSMDRDAIKRFEEEEEATKEEEERFRENVKADGLTDDDIGEPFGAHLKNAIATEKENASRAHWANSYQSMFEKSLKREEEILRARFLSSESPKHTQLEFDVEMEKVRSRLKKWLNQRLKGIPKGASGF
ncbi:hypothetical protein BKA64DRAFT_770558 [Cadophora sp. MPI-SDFR-AT-0126]|nr:hypothetical protein BKA64DRAFT_770558 [Leotiomycetes sp. MPI-SDFR-AT-0126]